MFGLPGGCILPGLRPAPRLHHPSHPRAPRAGRRPHGRGLRPRDRPSGRGHGHERPGRDQPGHPAVRRVHGLDPHGRHHRPGQPARDRHRRLPGVRHRRDHPRRSPSTTSWSWTPTTSPAWCARLFHIATTGRPGPVLLDVPKDVLQAEMEWYWPDGVDLPGLPPDDEGSSPDDQGGGAADHREPPPGALRRRRDPEVACRRGPAGARRPDRHPGGHHADGPWRLPRQPSPVPRHAGHARQLHGGDRHAARRSPHRPRDPVRRPGDRQGGDVRPGRQDHPRRHRPGGARQGPPSGRPDRRRLPVGDRGAGARPSGTLDDPRRPIGRNGSPGSASGRTSTR